MTTVVTLIITLVNIALAWVIMWHRLGKGSAIREIMRAYDTACRLNEEQSRAIDRLKREKAELINEINKLKQQ